MLFVRIQSKFAIPRECAGRSVPTVDGSDYLFQVTDEEYMFWNGLDSTERDELLVATSEGCFFDVLHKAMRKMRPDNYTANSSVWVELKP